MLTPSQLLRQALPTLFLVAAMLASGRTANAVIDVYNGVPAPITDAYPGVASVWSDYDDIPFTPPGEEANGSIGSGFLVAARLDPMHPDSNLLSGRVLGTAAHVLTGPFTRARFLNADGTLRGDYAGLRIRYPGYTRPPAGPLDANLDVAIVLLEESAKGIQPLELADSLPASGAQVRLAGGGTPEGRESNLNGVETRVGTAVLELVSSNVLPTLVIKPDRELGPYMTEFGDSGGPILGAFAGGNKVIGLTSVTNNEADPKPPADDMRVLAVSVADQSVNGFVRGGLINLRRLGVSDLMADKVCLSDVETLGLLGFHTSRNWSSITSLMTWQSLDKLNVWYNDYPSRQALGILNNDALDIRGGQNYGLDRFVDGDSLVSTNAPATHEWTTQMIGGGTRVASPQVTVLKVGESGILNGQSGSVRVIGGLLESSMVHNRGDFYVAPAFGRLFHHLTLDGDEGFVYWSAGLRAGNVLNEGHMVLDRTYVDIAHRYGTAPEVLEAAAAAVALEGSFVQSIDGVLDIVWDDLAYADRAPIAVEGDLLLSGEVNVSIPDDASWVETRDLQLFAVQGSIDISGATLRVHSGGQTFLSELRVRDGKVVALSVAEPATPVLAAMAALSCCVLGAVRRRRTFRRVRR